MAVGQPTPPDVSRNLADAITVGDLDRAVSCFSHRGRMMTPGETIVEGREALRELCAQLIGMQVRIRIEPHRALQLDDLAILSERWNTARNGVAGSGVSQQTSRALSLHRRIDREGWKIVFLAPWGFT
jgi:ketosteroid isomerase-like protein